MDMDEDLDDAVQEQLSLGSFEVQTAVRPHKNDYSSAALRINST